MNKSAKIGSGLATYGNPLSSTIILTKCEINSKINLFRTFSMPCSLLTAFQVPDFIIQLILEGFVCPQYQVMYFNNYNVCIILTNKKERFLCF